METLVRIAEISRLKLSEREANALQKDMEGVLKQFSIIQQINTEHVKTDDERVQELRGDTVAQFDNADAIVSQFCRKSNRHMLAPKGLE
jgi:aspartyl/glutamyl-tRNA(Asn/Gln) amidotransferase C subunit